MAKQGPHGAHEARRQAVHRQGKTQRRTRDPQRSPQEPQAQAGQPEGDPEQAAGSGRVRASSCAEQLQWWQLALGALPPHLNTASAAQRIPRATRMASRCP